MSKPFLSLSIALTIASGATSVAAAQRNGTSPKASGFVVLHFVPTTAPDSPDACREAATSAVRGRTLFREYRAADGTPMAITGHVALRFKASTRPEQIDSLIAATGLEVFSSVSRSACRRYVFSVASPTGDPVALADALRGSGLVEYATPDYSADRSEGIRSDSFFVNQLDLRNAVAGNRIAVSAAPAKFGMGQVLSEYTGPLLRVDGSALPTQLSSMGSSATAVDFVKAQGITTLRLQIPDGKTQASVRVTVYSLNGTAVRQLVSESLDAGDYLVGWDGNDDGGRRVQPGVYVAVMTAGNFRETRRLVVR